jgi:membrane-associated phospholipid phosphatase
MTIPGLVVFVALSAAAPPPGNKQPEKPRLVRQIGIDFKTVFTTKENLATLGVGLGAAWGAGRFDQELATSELNSELHPGTGLDSAFEAGEILGGAVAQVGGAVATYGLGKLFENEGVEDLGRDLVRAQVVTQSLTLGVKLITQRERPDGSSHFSFPSGHASGAFATATVLQRHYGWKVGAPAYAVAGYIATSRLNEGTHYLSDVVFGAALGVLVGRSVTLEIARARFAVTPSLPEGGVGVQLTWLGSSDGPSRSR